ncbi:MAG: hypothetical protein M1480_10900 [Bacteroidetes bacterium]|nr:hypothetical protein [Bacteroidota bacterium]
MYDLDEAGYKFEGFTIFILEKNNQIIKYDFIKQIMEIAGEDVYNDIRKFQNASGTIPINRLGNLIIEWNKLTPADYTADQLQFLKDFEVGE